ncbi:hypothetical protein [Yokenella regensburgei]|uniref:hypothetical protein n=1 Tax=Yokenella regensburgei TaxID=158877 RepID=UPI003F153ED4
MEDPEPPFGIISNACADVRAKTRLSYAELNGLRQGQTQHFRIYKPLYFVVLYRIKVVMFPAIQLMDVLISDARRFLSPTDCAKV